MGPHESPKSFYTNASLEFIEACEELIWHHGRLLRPETKEITERAARRMQEGTFPGLVQSGLQKLGGLEAWRVIVFFETFKTNWQIARHLMNCGSIHHSMDRLFLFGAKKNKSSQFLQKTKSRLHQFGSKVLSGVLRRLLLERGEKLGWRFIGCGCYRRDHLQSLQTESR